MAWNTYRRVTLQVRVLCYDKSYPIERSNIGAALSLRVHLFNHFDDRARIALEHILHVSLTSSQQTQSKLPTRLGGIGLTNSQLDVSSQVAHTSDLSFVSARRQYHQLIMGLLPTSHSRLWRNKVTLRVEQGFKPL